MASSHSSPTTKTNIDKVRDVEYGQVVLDNLASTTKVNKKLKLMVTGLSILAVLLVGCVFGVSIAAGLTKKDT
jgi:hypothetical protein